MYQIHAFPLHPPPHNVIPQSPAVSCHKNSRQKTLAVCQELCSYLVAMKPLGPHACPTRTHHCHPPFINEETDRSEVTPWRDKLGPEPGPCGCRVHGLGGQQRAELGLRILVGESPQARVGGLCLTGLCAPSPTTLHPSRVMTPAWLQASGNRGKRCPCTGCPKWPVVSSREP